MAWIRNNEVRNLVDDLHHKTLVEIAEEIIAQRDEIAERGETISNLEGEIKDLAQQVRDLERDAAAEAAA